MDICAFAKGRMIAALLCQIPVNAGKDEVTIQDNHSRREEHKTFVKSPSCSPSHLLPLPHGRHYSFE